MHCSSPSHFRLQIRGRVGSTARLNSASSTHAFSLRIRMAATTRLDEDEIHVVASLSRHRHQSSIRSVRDVVVGKPGERFEIAEVAIDVVDARDEVEYPSGMKLWMNLIAMMLCCFLRGLDVTIVGVAVPSITNSFRTIADIGWYSAVNGIVIGSTCFFFGKVYTVFDTKRSLLAGTFVFWLGSVVCTFAPTSKSFIFGRALVSLGAAWQGGGIMTQLNLCFPLQRRPAVMGGLMFTQSMAMVGAPVLGGALINRFGWRACFGISVPLNLVALAFTAYGMKSVGRADAEALSLWEKIKRLDILGTLVFVPAITCLLVALQWGGIRYSWHDGRIIALLVVAVVVLAIFAYLQYFLQEKAVLPPRILKQRSILAGAWFNACCDGVLATTEYYMSIYFQGVRGLTPIHAGVLAVPMIVGMAASTLLSGAGISKLGYYTPFMLFTSIVAPVASGLLTTLDLESQLGKAAGLLGLLGFAIGIGMSGPSMAVSTSLETKDVAVGSAIITFGGGMGSALFISVAATLFQNRLEVELRERAPNANSTLIEMAGLSDIRNVIGQDQMRQVLTGYDKATVQTLYIPLALAVASLLGSGLTEWRSVKKKQS